MEPISVVLTVFQIVKTGQEIWLKLQEDKVLQKYLTPESRVAVQKRNLDDLLFYEIRRYLAKKYNLNPSWIELGSTFQELGITDDDMIDITSEFPRDLGIKENPSKDSAQHLKNLLNYTDFSLVDGSTKSVFDFIHALKKLYGPRQGN